MSENLSKIIPESRVRRVARKAGLVAKKSRQRTHVPNLDNFGDFMLCDASTNAVVAGSRYDLEPQDVIEYCEWYEANCV